MIIELLQYGPAIAGLLFAGALWRARRRTAAAISPSTRILTATGTTVALAGFIAFYAWGIVPTWLPPLGDDVFLILNLARFVAPLAFCLVCLLFLIAPPARADRPERSALLARRTPMTFAPRRWTTLLTAVAVVAIALALLAGFASTPDEEGRFVVYGVDAASTTASTTIYGWWFSIPSLCCIAGIGALALIGLVTISRPPLALDDRTDTAARTIRVTNILAVCTGGILIHIGAVLGSLHGTSSLRLGLSGGTVGLIELGTSFAAIGPTMLIVSYIAVVAGLALWWATLLSALPGRTLSAQTAGSSVLT